MREFESRIKKLRAAIGELPALLTVHYADGQKRTMRSVDAILEALYNKEVENVTGGDKAEGRFVEILQAVAGVEVTEN